MRVSFASSRGALAAQQERAVLRRIDAQAGELERLVALRRRCDARTARERLDARHELGHPERLGEVVVGAQRERRDLVVLVAARADGQDRRHQALVARPLDQAPAVEARQHEIDDAHVGPLEAQLAQALGAVIGPLDVESRGAQVRPHRPRDDAVVLDYEHCGHPDTGYSCALCARRAAIW